MRSALITYSFPKFPLLNTNTLRWGFNMWIFEGTQNSDNNSYHNKVSQTGWIETNKLYCLRVLESRFWRQVIDKAMLSETCSTAFSEIVRMPNNTWHSSTFRCNTSLSASDITVVLPLHAWLYFFSSVRTTPSFNMTPF